MRSFGAQLVGAASLAFFWPVSGAGTNFLDHHQLLAGIDNPGWFEQNIPFLDVPSQQIQEVYYYRWRSYKEHLAYTSAQYGYLSSEFLYPSSYGAPFGGIVAAAGHHINEGRWVRDQSYGRDVVNYWLSGPGQFSKPREDGVNADTSDWAHEYSFWAASSVWRQYLVTGDRDFVIGQLENLVNQYLGWDDHFNDDLGLYWQVPVWDATEFTAASYESSDPYHGGAGYRPTINAYQYGDARAIATIAAMKGDAGLADEFWGRADSLQSAMQSHLWDEGRQFFMHRARDNNTGGSLLTTREIMGFVPWMFNMPQAADIASFAQLNDSQGFAADFGPTTAERRSKWFMYDAEDGCCRWDGPSWPYATAQTLTAVENVLNDYPAQSYITSSDYVTLLQRYAATQYKDGSPHVAEAHYPDKDMWIYDSYNHSEDYNHSTFVDNIIAGLIGLRARSDNSLIVNPLAPSSWDHFALENTPYHGHSVTVLWDGTGSHYNQGKGMKVFVDGNLAGSRDTVGTMTVNVGSVIRQTMNTKVNIAANSQNFSQGTTPFASYSYSGDDSWHAIDGLIWRVGIPENTRWTSYQSPNSQDHIGIDLRRTQAVSDVRLYFYHDNDGVPLPTSYDLQYSSGNSWVTVPNQQRTALSPTVNDEILITFPTITTSQLRLVAPNAGNGKGWGLSEFEVWTAPIFQFRNENSGKLMGVDHESHANSANIQQYEDNGSRDHLWKFVENPDGWYKIENMESGLLLAVQGASTENSAQLQQYEDSGTSDHLWRVESKGDGLFFIRNKNSRLLAGVDGMSTDNSANIVQFVDNGTKDHLWSILPAVPAN